jgi:putative transposase
VDLKHHCDYIHYNPVKHELVRCAHEWPYSSFSRVVREGEYPWDWGCGSQSPSTLMHLDETAME